MQGSARLDVYLKQRKKIFSITMVLFNSGTAIQNNNNNINIMLDKQEIHVTTETRVDPGR